MVKNDGKECINSFGQDYISVSQAKYDKWELALSNKHERASMWMRGERLAVDKNDDGSLEIYYRKLFTTEWKIVPLMVN
tara:strand:- start:716 stop:952 length:237 start_codon:yes stop_codon:yes gene_type:complete